VRLSQFSALPLAKDGALAANYRTQSNGNTNDRAEIHFLLPIDHCSHGICTFELDMHTYLSRGSNCV